VPWFFGDGYDKVIILIRILAFLILAIGINNVTGMQYLIPTKRQNIFTITVILGASTNFIMNLILIPLLQSVGAAIASVAAETVIAVVQIIIVRKELNPLTILKEGIHYYISGTIMAILIFILEYYLIPSITNTAILVLSGGIIYFGVLFVLKDEFMISNLKQVLLLIGKKQNC
jgi:O-antigen/teichoic acid export membrane protein